MSEETNIATVKQVVADFVGNGYMFTAYDITVYMRTRHSGIRMRHGKVNEIVTNMFADGEMMDYEIKTIAINLPAGLVHARLYYHRLSQSSRYVQDWLTSNPAQDNMRYTDAAEPASEPASEPIPTVPVTPTVPPSISISTDDDLTF